MAAFNHGTLLEPVQHRGREALDRLGFPTGRQEAWRFTNLSRLKAVQELPVIEADPLSDLPEAPSSGLRMLIGSGADPLEALDLPEGITVLSPDQLRLALGSTLNRCGCSDNWPVELNHASSRQVLALRISGNVPPLELVIGASGQGLLSTRVLLLLDEKADLDLLQVFRADRGAAHSHLCEVVLGQDSRLRHGVLSLGDGSGSLLTTLAAQQEPRSSYELTSVCQGWSFGRIEPRVVQLDGQAKTSLKGLAVTAQDQQLAVHSAMRFEGPEGELDQLQKSLAAGRSHAIFNGSIQVPRAAQLTNASQLSRNLLLSTKARIDTKPELEIIADDVRCAHGATVSQLQEDELFYLRSRGISEMDATALLLRGYCKDVIDQLPVQAGRWRPLEHVQHELSR